MVHIPHPQTKHFYQRWWFWFLIIITVLIFLAVFIGKNVYTQAQIERYDYLTEAVEVERRTISNTITASGTMTPEHTATLIYTVPSTVREVGAKAGEYVQKGDMLVKTDEETITAPFDSHIVRMSAFVDAPVTPTMPAVEIAYHTSRVDVYVSDSEVLDIEVGQEVQMQVPAHKKGTDEFFGTVEYVEMKKFTPTTPAETTADNNGYLVRISTEDMPEKLTHLIGLSVDVEIHIDTRTNVLALPNGVIQYDDDQAFIYRVPTVDTVFVQRVQQYDDVTRALQRQEIEVDFVGDEYTEITNGVEEGETVLLYINPPTTDAPF